MVRNYTPVDQKAQQWAKVFKIIRSHSANGIAVYDLAEELGLDKGDKSLAKTIDLLEKQGRIRLSIGGSKSGLVCRVVQAVELPDTKTEDENE